MVTEKFLLIKTLSILESSHLSEMDNLLRDFTCCFHNWQKNEDKHLKFDVFEWNIVA